MSALLTAIRSADPAAAKAALESNTGLAIRLSLQGLSPLMLALYHRQPEIVELILPHCGERTIFEAAALGELAQVKSLLERYPNLLTAHSADGFTALGLGSFFGQEEVVTTLIAAGAEVNAASNNEFRVMPLHSAVAIGHLAIARRLLEAGADPNAAQQKGIRPLHSAAHTGNLPMVELLLTHGANASLPTEDGRTAQDFAQADGHEAVAKRLGEG